MPYFFFDTHNGDHLARDSIGLDLPDRITFAARCARRACEGWSRLQAVLTEAELVANQNVPVVALEHLSTEPIQGSCAARG